MAEMDSRTVMMNVAAAFGAGTRGVHVTPGAVAFAYKVFGKHAAHAARNWHEYGPGICGWAKKLGRIARQQMVESESEAISVTHIRKAWQAMPRYSESGPTVKSARSADDCPYC
jgi:hypothetical protein